MEDLCVDCGLRKEATATARNSTEIEEPIIESSAGSTPLPTATEEREAAKTPLIVEFEEPLIEAVAGSTASLTASQARKAAKAPAID